jgi:DNA primase
VDIAAMKEYILENNYAPDILEKLGCHHIKDKGDYLSCSNPDGDNTSAVTLYLNTNLTVVNYTRTLNPNKKSHDIFDLVEFYLKINFFEAVKQLCDWCDLDYYKDWNEDIPESLKITKMLMELDGSTFIEDDNSPLKPIPEHILTYYYPYVNDMFANDNISYKTQRLFEVGYDDFTNRITIPIRDELNNLVGVKGRLFKEHLDENDLKYLYIEPVNRSKILYGLNLTLPFILQAKYVYVVESEKAVMQLWDMGICNVVATGGKKVSQTQIDMLSRLCVDIIFCFDADVDQIELEELADRFVDSVNIYALIDKNHDILDDKESPSDNPDKFKVLVEEHKYRIK